MGILKNSEATNHHHVEMSVCNIVCLAFIRCSFAQQQHNSVLRNGTSLSCVMQEESVNMRKDYEYSIHYGLQSG